MTDVEIPCRNTVTKSLLLLLLLLLLSLLLLLLGEHQDKDSVTILWDLPIHTDRTIVGNRSDIVLKNEKDKTCLLIDTTIPLDTNASVKTTEKLKKTKTWTSRF